MIQHQAQTLVDRVNLFLGGKSVSRLRIVQGPLSTPPRPQAPRRPPPLTAQEELSLQQTVSDVEDDKMKNSLLRLGRAVMKRQKTT